MKIIYLGDVVARCGREAVISAIPDFRKEFNYDALIVNVDNVAHGFGCTPKIARQFLDAGVSALVCGDHVWNQQDLQPFLDECNRIIRPINFPDTLAGVGARIIPLDTGKKILVAEVMGRVFMDDAGSYIDKIEELLKQYHLGKNIDAIFIDVHAEATAEKQAFARHFDGQVSAIIGSHTHVPTSDAIILAKGTAYQTDTGMCGNYDGVIGFDDKAPIERLQNKNASSRLEPKGGPAIICGVFIQTDDKTGLAVKIEAIKH